MSPTPGVQRLPAVQRTTTGTFESIPVQVEDAAVYAHQLAIGATPSAGLVRRRLRSGGVVVPALLNPVALTKESLPWVVVSQGLWSGRRLCAPPLAPVCDTRGFRR